MSKFCKDCKFYLPSDFLPRCARAVNTDLVTGEEKNGFCDSERTFDSCCGSDAKYFEPKAVEAPQASAIIIPLPNRAMEGFSVAKAVRESDGDAA